MSRRRWWVVGLTAWAAVVLAAALWAVANGDATVREQSDLATGVATLDTAVAELAEAAEASPGANVTVDPRVISACQITVIRRGTEVDQTIRVTVPNGQEGALLERLASELPDEWGAGYRPATGQFRADAGDFVAIRGEAAGAGEVRLTAGTGCRPGDDPASG